MSDRPGDDFHEVYERIMRLALVADQDSPGVTEDRDKAITSLQRLEARLAEVERERDETVKAARDADVLVQSVLLEGSEARRDKTIGALQHRIDTLRQENEKLREALERIAMLPNNGKGTVWSPISEALGIARAALDQPQEQE